MGAAVATAMKMTAMVPMAFRFEALDARTCVFVARYDLISHLREHLSIERRASGVVWTTPRTFVYWHYQLDGARVCTLTLTEMVLPF